MHRMHHKRLAIDVLRRRLRGIPCMSDSQTASQIPDVVVVEDVPHKAHAFMHVEIVSALTCCNP